MGNRSNTEGNQAEALLASEVARRGGELHDKFSELAGSRALRALVVSDKSVKQDIAVELANGSQTLVSVKSSIDEGGTSGHAGRMDWTDAKAMGASVDAQFCLKTIAWQEYWLMSEAAMARVAKGAAELPSRRLARLAIAGSLSRAPEFMAVVFSGGAHPRVLLAKADDLLRGIPELGAILRLPPRDSSFEFASASFGNGIVGIKRDGGSSASKLQFTFSSAKAGKLFDQGLLPTWISAKIGL